MTAREDGERERAEQREDKQVAEALLTVGSVRIGDLDTARTLRRLLRRFSPADAMRRLFSTAPGAASSRLPKTSATAAAAPEPTPERLDQVTALLDDIGRPVTEEALHVYGEMSDEVFDTIARDLRDAYHRPRHPLQAEAERRAAQVRR